MKISFTDVSFNVINLKHRKDRLDKFLSIVPKKIKPLIKIFDAIDKNKVTTPSSWTHGDGAYGCYLSHMQIIKKHINSDYKYLCIFEDDAIFDYNFCEQLYTYLNKLPGDADQFFLGGQYYKLKPVECIENLWYNVPILRTHAYITKIDSCKKIYQYLDNHINDINLNNHIDHIYAKLHLNQELLAYSPKKWLCGQGAGYSDIANEYNDMNRWWNTTRKKPKDPGNRLILVLGTHGSGTSCVSSILQKLGVFTGNNICGYWSKKGGGGEDQDFNKICESIFKTPATETTMTKTQIINRLNGWITSHRNKGKQLGLSVSCKYPTICAMGEYLKEIIDDKYLKIINCERSLDESILSMSKRGYELETITKHQKWLYANKLEFLSRIEKKQILTINFTDMLSDPNQTVQSIINFLEINPSQDQVENAINHVIPF